MSPPIERSSQLKILLSEEEREGLQLLADRAGLTVSDYVRQWIRRELIVAEQATIKVRSEKPKKR